MYVIAAYVLCMSVFVCVCVGALLVRVQIVCVCVCYYCLFVCLLRGERLDQIFSLLLGQFDLCVTVLAELFMV